MNYFKHSPLPKLAANRVRKHNTRNPNKIIQRSNVALANLDILEVYAQRARMEARQSTGKVWKGGDDQDRLDYIKAKKAEIGFGLDRVLSFSNKRMPSGHYLKDDPCYIEFTGFERARDISPTLLQPADMAWSVEEFLKKLDSTS